MSKRGATRELNHDNWDDDEEEEDAGTFQQASSEALQTRVIKQARRRLAGNDGEAKKNVFAGFSGFGARPTPSSNAFNINFAAKQPTLTEPSKPENGAVKPASSDVEATNEKEYLASLKVLNETVSSWIADHVKKNPCCVLTPIFQDYEKHLKDLESKRTSSASKENKSMDNPTKTPFTFGKVDSDDKNKQPQPAATELPKQNLNFFGNGATPAKTPSFSFTGSTSTPLSSASSTFSFKKSDTETTAPSSTFSFGSGSTASATAAPAAAPASLFSFGASKTTPATGASSFSFGFTGAKPAAIEEKKEDGDGDKEGDEGEDEDAPPKVEVKQVQEDDAFYSIKCKLFYKKDNNYTEKGVGMLHLKKIKDDKTQLVIRADTSLGNILLNIILNPQITTQRIGKNNVMFVCIPNPPIDKAPPAPTPMLLRVKTDVEADELLAKLNDAKK